MAGEGVGGLLDHKGLLVEVEVFSGALPLSFLLVGFVSSGSYSYPCMRPQSQQQFDQCDQLEEELGRAQSKPTLAKSILKQVRQRAAPTFQSGFNVSLGVFSFLFPSNFTN